MGEGLREANRLRLCGALLEVVVTTGHGCKWEVSLVFIAQSYCCAGDVCFLGAHKLGEGLRGPEQAAAAWRLAGGGSHCGFKAGQAHGPCQCRPKSQGQSHSQGEMPQTCARITHIQGLSMCNVNRIFPVVRPSPIDQNFLFKSSVGHIWPEARDHALRPLMGLL